MNKISLIIFLIFIYISNSKANNIINIKSTDRGEYIRIVFETKEKPNYKVYQEHNKIFILLKNTDIAKEVQKNIEKFNFINDMVIIKNKNDLKFSIILNNNTKLKRHLYTEPDKYHNYRLIIDIERKNYDITTLDDLISKKINLTKQKQTIEYNILENFIENNIDTKNNYENINDLIETNVKANDINELLALNNIDLEVVKDLEIQNNDKINMDNFLKSITEDIETDIKTKRENEEELKLADKIINKKDKYIVVIDAGHGGKDPGAIGFRKTKEKNINLEYAKYIKKELEKNKNIIVFLTRNDDYFIELKNRINKARSLEADLFISVHSDSNKNKNANGLSVYTISNEMANKRLRQNLKSNMFSNINKNYKKSYNNKKDSDNFAEILIKNFNRNNINMIYNPHKYAGFAVLMSSDFPSVLIELGFLSNKNDEKILKSNSYKKQIAKSISISVKNYINLNK